MELCKERFTVEKLLKSYIRSESGGPGVRGVGGVASHQDGRGLTISGVEMELLG